MEGKQERMITLSLLQREEEYLVFIAERGGISCLYCRERRDERNLPVKNGTGLAMDDTRAVYLC